jgi:hypothetical protein
VQLLPLGGSREAVIAVLLSAAILTGCGGSSSTKKSAGTASATPTTLALSISEAGQTSKFAGPASVKGGVVTVQLTNNGKGPHGAQLIRIEGGHTIEEAVRSVASESHKVPSWLRAEGGVGAAVHGQSAAATVSLQAGSYAVVDFAGAQEGHGGPPAVAPLTVTPGQEGAVPVTGTTITAANPSKDHYKWEISGPLKAGANPITFVSKGKTALHELRAIRITGNESTAQLVKALESERPPPSYVDRTSQFATAVLDGGKSLTTQMTLLKPGKYVFFCHLTDRDGGKPHFAEGLITAVTVQ